MVKFNIPLKEQFKMSYNMMMFILITEAILFSIEYFSNGLTPKAWLYVAFMGLTKLSQINTIHYFNRLELEEL